MIRPLLKDYTVILEPGRSVIADAGLLLVDVLYVKHQAGQISPYAHIRTVNIGGGGTRRLSTRPITALTS